MEIVFAIIVMAVLVRGVRSGLRRLFSCPAAKNGQAGRSINACRETFFEYPEGGYGLASDPVADEMIFLEIMEDDR